MNDSFKKFYNKNTDKLDDRTFLETLLGVAKEIYSQNPYVLPEELFTYASESLVQKAVEDLNKQIKDVYIYAIDEIKEKFPQKINTDINDEESKDERTKETSNSSSK